MHRKSLIAIAIGSILGATLPAAYAIGQQPRPLLHQARTVHHRLRRRPPRAQHPAKATPNRISVLEFATEAISRRTKKTSLRTGGIFAPINRISALTTKIFRRTARTSRRTARISRRIARILRRIGRISVPTNAICTATMPNNAKV